MASLVGLPTELLVRCLYFLEYIDLLACRAVNRLLNTVINESSLLQYTIELAAAHAEDNPYCDLPASEKLRQLKARQNGWLYFNVAETIAVDVKHRPSGIYDFTGGVYLLGEAPHFGGPRPTKGLQYIRLPSLGEARAIRGELPWHGIDVKEDIVDVGLAVQEHDLIAVVTHAAIIGPNSRTFISFQILQFSTGKPHPLAAQPVIPVVEATTLFGHISVGIEIVGDLLVLLLTFPFALDAEDRLYVFDWKTGDVKLTHTARGMTYTSFTFLSPTTIVLPNLQAATLELCDLTDPDPGPPPRLKIHTRLGLPRLYSTCRIMRVGCRGEPNPAPSPRGPRYPRDPAPFHDAPADAIIVFNLLIQEQPLLQQLTSVSFVVHRSSLLARLAAGAQVPWARWGPRATRWFDSDDVPTRWITTTCGQRYVTTADELPSRVTVMDFGRHAVGRALARAVPVELEDGKRVWVHVLPSTLPDQLNVFEEEVTSELPYVETISDLEFEYDAVLMDEERIIGMKMDDVNDRVDQIDILYMSKEEQARPTYRLTEVDYWNSLGMDDDI
ncbi:hypothetical protein GLOTRDRAFT_74568 [Gloeophyllum trabeum ATCC 11539]|uniref:F-box domain-containing protein n=1 Tax=Gloeophyllum trabeum (strain ATCC 11539 / FP-39264 / Madison 617) TaxID=670483 RepID=S7QCQ7_GLOTA|nr:uncharacterized protein GLOTRDRAFT_74568 [Gloeophyllum trabeum ATCC 11539]EPQ57661.1 hypothetical protein GLOTRDRAFT_74568 [Gloeophyllum trabeum ATCC 11539]